MKPTEILSNEHRVIERALDVLDAIAKRACERNAIDLDASAKVLRVLRTFADECHHGKEENQLFPRIEQRGMPRHVGPMAVMLHEHELGRAAIRAMGNAVEAAKKNDASAPAAFAKHATEYTTLLREHIAKEDQILFPMAESMLTDADRADLLRQFANVEAKDIGAGVHEEMLALVDELCATLGVKPSQPLPKMGGCCHGHHH
ncbi:MAG: hemerythrin domain-containing protein [Planctomycetes bacterium]|nr:hemerythrin domain-containing protein [Planctomycetota bacterium]